MPVDPNDPDDPDFEPSEPTGPSEAPREDPGYTPDIDIPSPSTPGTEAPSTPISPVG